MNPLSHWLSPRRLARTCALGLVLLGPASGWAIAPYPGVVKSDLGLSTTPACTLCHQGTPQVGSVVTPFGKSMLARGLEYYNEPSLHKALTTLGTDKVDSDGDGTQDIEELKAGRDPNVSDAPSENGESPVVEPVVPEPSYGCTAAPGGSWVALLGLWGLRRGRRQ